MMKTLLWLCLTLPMILNGQVLNGDFEIWSDSLYSPIYKDLPAQNPKTSVPDNWTSGALQCRVENSYTGAYGMLCYTYYNYVPGWITYMDYTASKPDFLSGYYRYQLGGADYESAERYAEVTAWSNGDTIGTARFDFDTVSTYTYFKSPIQYTSNQAVDSLKIHFFTNGLGSVQIINGFLFLDRINLETNPVGQPDKIPSPSFKLYPNPAQNKLYLDCKQCTAFTYQIINLQGQVLKSGDLPEAGRSINLEKLAAGSYLLKVNDETNESIVPFIKNTE